MILILFMIILLYAGLSPSSAVPESAGFFSRISISFTQNFIEGGQWKQLLHGIGVTLLLSFGTLVLGTLLGVVYAYGRVYSRFAVWLDAIGIVVDTLPLLILLMLLYYVVFAWTGLPAFFIALIGMVIYFSNNVSSLLMTGIEGVDLSEINAAIAMGYKPYQVFFKITLPHAIQQMYDLYIGSVLTMVKDTSIVGFMAIQDLTNISSGIWEDSNDLLIPLLLKAILYYMIARCLIEILDYASKRVVNHRKIRTLKEVVDYDSD